MSLCRMAFDIFMDVVYGIYFILYLSVGINLYLNIKKNIPTAAKSAKKFIIAIIALSMVHILTRMAFISITDSL